MYPTIHNMFTSRTTITGIMIGMSNIEVTIGDINSIILPIGGDQIQITGIIIGINIFINSLQYSLTYHSSSVTIMNHTILYLIQM